MTLSPRVLQLGLIGSLALNLFLGGLMLGKVLRPEPKPTGAAPIIDTVPSKDRPVSLPDPAPLLQPAEAPVPPKAKSEPTQKTQPAHDRPEDRARDHGGGEPDGPPHGLRQVIGTLDRADQQALRTGLRQVMLQSREDKRAVRRLRLEAARLAAEPEFDTEKVSTAMARVRAAELEGRARSEANLMATLAKLSPEGRQKVAPALLLRKRDRSDAASTEGHKGPDDRPGL